MQPLLDRAGARELDRRVMDAGVPGVILMENAGRGAADVLIARFPHALDHVVVVGGTGQNGGDAWVVARRLRAFGRTPTVFLAGRRADVRGDAAINLAALDAVGLPVTELEPNDLGPLEAALASATLVVEGLFGTGLDRPIEGWRAEVVGKIDTCRAPVVALDLPSGIDSDTGRVLGVSLHAALTVTFAATKRGLWQFPGRAYAGDVVCVDIGVPPPVARDGLLELSDAAAWLPPRSTHAHKGTAGHVLVVAGSPGRTGAALLAGLGALRGGAGLVTIGAREGARAALDQKVVELMTELLPSGRSAEAALALAHGKASAAIGPGLGLDPEGRALARQLSVSLEIPAVIDADALTALADAGLRELQGAAPRVLTPHPGEAGRLLGCTTEDVQRDRYEAARRLAVESGQVVVLKGAGTVIADPSGRLAVCPLGTPALGVAGTGDVLTGVLAAALAAAPGTFEAACAAVVLHARAGERAACADRGLLAHEVADEVPRALSEARG